MPYTIYNHDKLKLIQQLQQLEHFFIDADNGIFHYDDVSGLRSGNGGRSHHDDDCRYHYDIVNEYDDHDTPTGSTAGGTDREGGLHPPGV